MVTATVTAVATAHRTMLVRREATVHRGAVEKAAASDGTTHHYLEG